jgi:hypothetical protein
MKTTKVLFMIALIFSMGMQAEAKKVKLQYQLKAGDKFLLERSTKQDIAQEMMGQTQSTTSNSAMTYEFNVTGINAAGDYTLTVAMVEFSMAATNPMGELKYNSATDSVVPEFAKGMSILLKEVYTMDVSTLGKITNVKAPEGMAEKINKLMEGMGAEMMAMGGGALADAATAEGVQKSMEGLITPYPDGGADVKKPWETESKIQQMISFNTKTKYELVKASKEMNEIKVAGQIIQDPSSPPMEMQGMNITYELVGSNAGVLKSDAVTGLINTSEMVTTISGTINVDSPQLPSPMSIPMTVQMTDKVVRK